MSKDECVGRGGEGDCAVRIVFDQDADGHCRRSRRAAAAGEE